MTCKQPKEILDELDSVMKKFGSGGLHDYLGINRSNTKHRKDRGQLPYKKVKSIVEFIEMHNDDCVTLCQDLMDYYNYKIGKKTLSDNKN